MDSQERDIRLLAVPANLRTEKYQGRDHLVVPVVALMEGVIHAVNAPVDEYVPMTSLSTAPQGWNGRPIVYGHPKRNGRQISANEPQVLADHAFGTIFDSKMNGKKLTMEAWIDPIRAKEVGAQNLIDNIRAGRVCEVSVGAFVTTTDTPGNYNGKPYKAVWKDVIPDHLAFLHDQVGACSIEMGCGTPRTAALHDLSGDEIVVPIVLRNISQDERDKMDELDFAGPGTSFPIQKQADVDAAAHLIGHAANPEAVKSKIISIAKRKGLSIPDSWKTKEVKAAGGVGSGPHASGAGAAETALSSAGKWFGGKVDSQHASVADAKEAGAGAHGHLLSQGFKQEGPSKAIFGVPNGSQTNYSHENGQSAKIITSGFTGKSGAMSIHVKGGAPKTSASSHPPTLVGAGGPGSGPQGGVNSRYEKVAKAHDKAAHLHQQAAKTGKGTKSAGLASENAIDMHDQLTSPAMQQVSATASGMNHATRAMEYAVSAEAMPSLAKGYHEKAADFHTKAADALRNAKESEAHVRHAAGLNNDEIEALGGPGSGPQKGGGHSAGGGAPKATDYKDNTGSNRPGVKDHLRIRDIMIKSGGNVDKQHALARQMANSIDKPDKAMRRAKAAEENAPHLAGYFHQRVGQLSGGAKIKAAAGLFWRWLNGGPGNGGGKMVFEAAGGPGSGPQVGANKPTHEVTVQQINSNTGKKEGKYKVHVSAKDEKEAFEKAQSKRGGFNDQILHVKTLQDNGGRMAFKVGDKVKVNKPGHDAHGKTGVVAKSMKGGTVHSVAAPDKSPMGTFHQSNLKAAAEAPTLRERMKSLLAKIRTADDSPSEAASEEAAELIGYQTLKSLFDQIDQSHDAASSIVDQLISDEVDDPTDNPDDEDAEEEVEAARLEAVRTYCMAMYSTLNGVMSLVTDLLTPDEDDPAPPRYMAGARHSAADKAIIQTVHDHTVALGANCPTVTTAAGKEMKTCEDCQGTGKTYQEVCPTCGGSGKVIDTGPTNVVSHTLAQAEADRIVTEAIAEEEAAIRAVSCGCQGGEGKMTKEQKTEIIKTLVEDKHSGFVKGDEKMLEVASDERLESLRVAAEARAKEVKAAAAVQPKELTEEEFMKVAPQSLKTLIKRTQDQDIARKAELVAALKAAQSEFTESELAAMPLDSLERQARVLKLHEEPEQPNYIGRGMPRAAATSDQDVFANPPDPWAPGLAAMRTQKTVQ